MSPGVFERVRRIELAHPQESFAVCPAAPRSTSTSPASASDITRSAAWTATPRTSSPTNSLSPVCRSTRIGRPVASVAGWRGRIRTFDLLIQRTPDASVDGRCDLSVARDSDSVDPAGNQVEHAGRSQVNVIRSSNSGIDRIVPDHPWEGERFLMFQRLPEAQHRRGVHRDRVRTVPRRRSAQPKPQSSSRTRSFRCGSSRPRCRACSTRGTRQSPSSPAS